MWLNVSMHDSVFSLTVTVVMEMSKFTALYDTLVSSGDDEEKSMIVAIVIVYVVLAVCGIA